MAPDDTDTYNDLGLALYYSGDSAEALRVLKEGAEKDPGFQRIWLTLGFVQMHTDERGEARFALQQAIKLGGDNEVGAEASRILESLANAE
jgi:Flp pilus assembly protein TadD